MRGKKPKERQRYVLRVNETLVEVTRDVSASVRNAKTGFIRTT